MPPCRCSLCLCLRCCAWCRVDLATKGWLQETVARWVRQLISTLVVLGICLGIALGAQGASGTVLTFTGATFVAIGERGGVLWMAR